MKRIATVIFSMLLLSCAGVPDSINPVTDFDLTRYAGKWYEIARLDHRFERGLQKVSANYSINSDGSVRVENRGFSTKSQEWEDAIGKGKFAGDASTGHLKVSFFGPFFGSYIIFELDKENYQYSFVTGSQNTLWFLSRTPEVSDELKDRFLTSVQDAGYNTDDLIFVNQG